MQDEIDAMKGGWFESKVVDALSSREWREIKRTQRSVARLSAQSGTVSDTAAQVSELEMKVSNLEDNLLSLGLYTRTILQLLVDSQVISFDAFESKLEEIDLLDGKLDGK